VRCTECDAKMVCTRHGGLRTASEYECPECCNTTEKPVRKATALKADPKAVAS
jgi:hypothetical protein